MIALASNEQTRASELALSMALSRALEITRHKPSEAELPMVLSLPLEPRRRAPACRELEGACPLEKKISRASAAAHTIDLRSLLANKPTELAQPMARSLPLETRRRAAARRELEGPRPLEKKISRASAAAHPIDLQSLLASKPNELALPMGLSLALEIRKRAPARRKLEGPWPLERKISRASAAAHPIDLRSLPS